MVDSSDLYVDSTSYPTGLVSDQRERVLDFITWLRAMGGSWHEDLEVRADDDWGGIAPFASADIPSDTTVIALPHHLVLTVEIALQGIATACGLDVGAPEDDALARDRFGGMKERQLIGCYVVLHWLMEDGFLDAEGDETSQLHHLPYIRSLPSIGSVLTPSFWSEKERSLISGSNLSHAVEDRMHLWHSEYEQSLLALSQPALTSSSAHRPIGIPPSTLQKAYTWPRYLQAQTYISSRAFPSILLDKFTQQNPTTILTDEDPGTYPVLLPGIDMSNHRRAEKVTWGSRRVPATKPTVGFTNGNGSDSRQHAAEGAELNGRSASEFAETVQERTEQELIVLVIYDGRSAGEQVFNNYGLKGNEEFILGYGFALDPNPDDNCALKLGSSSSLPVDVQSKLMDAKLDFSRSYYVGRDGELPPRLWECIKVVVAATGDPVEEPMDEDEIELAAAEQLEAMVSQKANGIKVKVDLLQDEGYVNGCRSSVVNMVRLYFRAQHEILVATRANLRKRMNELEIKLYGEEGEVAMRDSD